MTLPKGKFILGLFDRIRGTRRLDNKETCVQIDSSQEADGQVYRILKGQLEENGDECLLLAAYHHEHGIHHRISHR